MSALDASPVEATEVARMLVGSAFEVTRLVTGGRNSRVWHVRNGERAFALKQYPSQHDRRDRLATEVGALRLMEAHRINAVPRVVGVDSDRGYALLTWIEGADVVEVSDADIDAAAAFLATVHALRASPCAHEQPLAAEACLSGIEIEHQIERRLARLRAVASEERPLIVFLDNSFAGAFAKASRGGREAIMAAGLDFSAELPREWRSLAPSDFGFHNSLRRNDGSLAFVDFEYFGWDDPVKLTADILLHPGRTLASPQRKRFREAAGRLYGSDRTFVSRLSAYLPLFSLRWVLILLNEFLPERWQQRVRAGEVANWADAKARQLARAREFLGSSLQKLED